MEAWRHWLLGDTKLLGMDNKKRIHLTPTGLLMEGGYTQNANQLYFGRVTAAGNNGGRYNAYCAASRARILNCWRTLWTASSAPRGLRHPI
jgi:hypothetical protein